MGGQDKVVRTQTESQAAVGTGSWGEETLVAGVGVGGDGREVCRVVATFLALAMG